MLMRILLRLLHHKQIYLEYHRIKKREFMKRTKQYLPILLILSFILGASVLNSSNIIITQTNPGEVVFNYGKVNITMKPGSTELSQIILGDTFCRLNGTRFVVEANNWTNITINTLVGNTSTYKVQGAVLFNFTSNCSGGVVWFNLSGFPAGFVYNISRNGTCLGYYVVNDSGVLSFSNNVWSWYYFTGSLYGGGGGAIRSDGTYMYYTCEDGLLPTFVFERGVHSIDANSTLEGKYCLNVSCNGLLGNLNDYYQYDGYIRPAETSFRFMIDSTTDHTAFEGIETHFFIPISVFPPIGSHAAAGSVQFINTNQSIRVEGEKPDGTMMYRWFDSLYPWSYDTPYRITFSYDYMNRMYDCTVSNATSSQ